MTMVGLAVNRYAMDHDHNLPASLDVLLQDKKYLKSPDEAKSVLTGKPYVYIGAGRKLPEKFEELGRLILLYDDQEQNGSYQCVMGDSSGGNMPVNAVKDQVQKRGN